MKKLFLILSTILALDLFAAVGVTVVGTEMKDGISYNMGSGGTLTTSFDGANATIATGITPFSRPCIYNGGTTLIQGAFSDVACSSSVNWQFFIPSGQTACLDAVKGKTKICARSFSVSSTSGYLHVMTW